MMKFNLGDRVRVVSAASNFFGWEGEVVGCYDGDLVPGQKHYHVRCYNPAFEQMPPLLFNERELAFVG
jgi:hypothetical protein